MHDESKRSQCTAVTHTPAQSAAPVQRGEVASYSNKDNTSRSDGSDVVDDLTPSAVASRNAAAATCAPVRRRRGSTAAAAAQPTRTRPHAPHTRHNNARRTRCRRSPSVLLAVTLTLLLLCSVGCMLLARQLHTFPRERHTNSTTRSEHAALSPSQPSTPSPGACVRQHTHTRPPHEAMTNKEKKDTTAEGAAAAAAAATVGDNNGAAAAHDVVVEALPDGCRAPYCVSPPFGVVLGAHDGVLAFSNCYSKTCYSFVENNVLVRRDAVPASTVTLTVAADKHAGNTKGMVNNTRNARDVADDTNKSNTDSSRDDDTTKAADGVVSLYSGMMWQCVEYARRYWILRGAPAPATFGDVDGAEDIWTQLREVQLLNGTRLPLHKHGNGVDVLHGGSAPRRGDLLIYHREPTTMPYGHVAVIVGVDVAGARVYVAEQNWDSEVWPAPHHNYSRVLPLRVDAAAMRFTLVDEAAYPIAGWVRYGND